MLSWWHYSWVHSSTDFFATVYTVPSSVIISAYFFKYQFKQINRQISKVIRDKRPISKLKHLISLHNSIILEVEQYNSEVKYYLYILIKLIKPGFNTFVYLLFDPNSQWHLRVYVVLTMTGMVLFFIGMTAIFASATKFAHRPQFAFYTLLLSRDHNQNPLSLNERYKLMRFIERLSGPSIGFYCGDLFPLTTCNFIDYVLDSMVSFLLIVKFLKRCGLI